jgi:hypothetical protein
MIETHRLIKMPYAHNRFFSLQTAIRSFSKSGFMALKSPEDDSVITYLVGTKKQGISHYVKSGNTWKVKDHFTSKKELMPFSSNSQKRLRHVRDGLMH